MAASKSKKAPAKTTRKSAAGKTARKAPSRKELAAMAAAEQAQLAARPPAKSRAKPRFHAAGAGATEVEVVNGGGAAVVADVGSIEGANLKDYAQTTPVVGQKEGVVERSMTDHVVQQGLKRTSEIADEVSSRWQERMARDSVTKFKCPISGCKHEPFDKKNKCTEHMKLDHPQTLRMLKLTKAEKTQYTPIEIVVSPKRTIEDLVPAHVARHMKLAKETYAGMAHLQKRGRDLAKTGVATKAASLLTMPEFEAEKRIKTLDNDQLIDANRLLFARGKTNLVRTTRTIGRERGIKLPY